MEPKYLIQHGNNFDRAVAISGVGEVDMSDSKAMMNCMSPM